MLRLQGKVGVYLAHSTVSGKMRSAAKSAGVTVTHSVWIGRLHQESSHSLRKTWCKVWQQCEAVAKTLDERDQRTTAPTRNVAT